LSSQIAPVVRLANEIGRQFEHLPLDRAAAQVAAHLTSFWEPRMRAELLAVDPNELDPVAAAARDLLAHSSRNG
jgi:formate dehydrogenase subunit delta